MLNYEFPPLGGGASPVSYEIAKGYVKLGHSVDVITMGYKDLPNFEVKDGINIYRVKCLRSKKEICHPHEMLSYIIYAKKFLKEHMKKNKYNINHTHFIIPTGYIALWLKKNYQLPYIITSHGSDVIGYNKRFRLIYPLLVNKWKLIIKEAKYVTTPSNFLRYEIGKYTNEGNFTVIANGIDPNKFKPLKKDKKILIVSRLFENKGVQDILDALKDLDLKGYTVDIVGDGPYRNILEKKASENNLDDVVTFQGWVDNNSQEMKKLYGRAKIFISASYFENISIVLLEAAAAGCTIIASDVGGNPEIIKNKSNLFERANMDELREKINKSIKGKIEPIRIDEIFNREEIIKQYSNLLI